MDTNIGNFLASRRKLIAGIISIAGLLFAGQSQVDLAIQAVIAVLGVYGIHEVENAERKVII